MINSAHINYNAHVLYDEVGQPYGGIQDVVTVTNKLVENTKVTNKAVINVKTSNKLVDKITTNETYYWRILAGMPMGLLLSLTYPVDQDGEIRA